MKTAIALVGLMLAASATASPNPPHTDVDRAAVEKAERLWVTAMQRRDAAPLNELVAPDFALSGLEDLNRPCRHGA
jgi:hypothetical protein